MNALSFDIKNSKDFFRKLNEDYKEFQQDDTSSRIAINCAMTAWHLSEWIFNEYKLGNTEALKLFQTDLKKECPALQIMQDISNGSKHYALTKHKPAIESTDLHHGSFSSDFSRDFDISSLYIITKDGQKLYFEDELKSAVDFWTEFIATRLPK